MNPSSTELTVSDLLKLRNSHQDYLLLDIRETEETMICTFPDTVHIRMHQIPSSWATLPQDKQIIVFCHYGTRSRMVVEFLQQQGLMNTINLAGGIDAWAIEIEPTMERY
ncbi:MAG TPA: sulfurtransferase [Leucothrix mucor]|uniref:Sulfurtransferase n=1 Tax=Leucothrix mucor TaxID=45248 RepID=A0A7V2SY45_LEUMU|nr:sulfurtransferase [Leucothrix mucor]